MELKERILKEMLETEEDEIVRKFKKYPWFDEEEIRRLYRKVKKETDKK